MPKQAPLSRRVYLSDQTQCEQRPVLQVCGLRRICQINQSDLSQEAFVLILVSTPDLTNKGETVQESLATRDPTITIGVEISQKAILKDPLIVQAATAPEVMSVLLMTVSLLNVISTGDPTVVIRQEAMLMTVLHDRHYAIADPPCGTPSALVASDRLPRLHMAEKGRSGSHQKGVWHRQAVKLALQVMALWSTLNERL